jgi:hypothetical protein
MLGVGLLHKLTNLFQGIFSVVTDAHNLAISVQGIVGVEMVYLQGTLKVHWPTSVVPG